MTDTLRQLGFGWRYIVPEDAQAAWGARLIVNQDGLVDFLGDRTDSVGSDEARSRLYGLLEERFPLPRLLAAIREGLVERRIRTREVADISFFEDDDIAVGGNSNASAGYFYVSAWLKAGR